MQQIDLAEQKEVAKKLGTSGQTLPRYLRSADLGVEHGGRYGFDPDEVAELKKRFKAWRDEVARDRSAKAEEKAAEDHTCEECTKSFDSARALAGHKASHA